MPANYCRECGQEVPNGAKFCENCGRKLELATKTKQAVAKKHQKQETVFDGYEVVNPDNSTFRLSEKRDVNLVAQIIIYTLVGLNTLYLFYLCMVILIVIFKFSVLIGILLFVLGFIGVGVLFSPTWASIMLGVGLIFLAKETTNKVGRFLLLTLGMVPVLGLPYIILWLVGSLVPLILN